MARCECARRADCIRCAAAYGGVDEPFEDELPAFERRLADAIEACILLEAAPFDVSHLSWEGLTARIVEAL